MGNAGVTALPNGHYVVVNPFWDNGAGANAGAVTWCDGTTGRAGTASAANSLVGTATNDQVGAGGITILTNGNYVVNSFSWNSVAISGVGAATWCNGTTGITGAVSASNSLIGSSAGDQVSGGGTIALTNGNYVVRSQSWSNGGNTSIGAVTWGSGTTGISGVVSAANSLIGSTPGDQVGGNAVPPPYRR